MKLKVIIIPPDNAPNTDFFEHTLAHDEYHNDILIDYCNQYGVEANDIIAMTNIGYVVINTIDNNYLMFCYEDLSEKQLLNIKTIFGNNDKIDANLAFFGDLGFYNMGKVQSYEEFILAFNNLKNKKEGINYVR